MNFPASITSSRTLYHQVCALLVYQSVFEHPLGEAFIALLKVLQHRDGEQSQKGTDCLSHYSRWFRLLAASQTSWQDFLLSRVLEDENPFSLLAQSQNLASLPPTLVRAAGHDLSILQSIYYCTLTQIIQWVGIASQSLAEVIAWEIPNKSLSVFDLQQDWAQQLPQLCQHYRERGVGQFARFQVLHWQGRRLEGVATPDSVKLEDLVGYDEPKQALLRNTEALLRGYPALHVLLYGCRGSGKSSLVKALAPHYGPRGLRLIEVDQNQLQELPQIFELLRHRPQKFVLFVDDLSFEDDDRRFKSLKRVLEGGVTARPTNVVIYATSNRRHLVREFWGDRPQYPQTEEIQSWDTVQEKLSFADRFGLTLTFTPADQTTYLKIVHHLAQRAGLNLPTEELEFQAKQWAVRHNGRSGRTARQCVDYLQANLS